MTHDRAVSEIIGALLLIAVISIAVGIVGVTILSNAGTSQVPSLSVRITNDSRIIWVAHEGGDTLPPDSYAIFVDGLDRTGSFKDSSTGSIAGSREFKAGTLLQSDGSFPPSGSATLVYLGPEGVEAVLLTRYFPS